MIQVVVTNNSTSPKVSQFGQCCFMLKNVFNVVSVCVLQGRILNVPENGFYKYVKNTTM